MQSPVGRTYVTSCAQPLPVGATRSVPTSAQSTLWPSQLQHSRARSARYPPAHRSPADLLYVTCKAAANHTAGSATAVSMMTCRRCKQRFCAADNSSTSCRFHPALYSGGEVAKAIGFVRASDAPEDQLETVVGRKGLMRFWDCCGCENESAPGCCSSFHISFDDGLNEANGWN